MSNSNIAILGLGNILLQDEGVGVHIVSKLKQNYICNPAIKIIDGGTSGLDLIEYFEDNDKIIIIDAINLGKKPGHIYVFNNDEIEKFFTTNLSSHQVGLHDILSAVKLLQKEPSQIYLIGVQPASVETGLKLSDQVEKKLNKIFNLIFSKLKEWNVEVKLRDSI
jgi:hydrogenase maturation protease